MYTISTPKRSQRTLLYKYNYNLWMVGLKREGIALYAITGLNFIWNHLSSLVQISIYPLVTVYLSVCFILVWLVELHEFSICTGF